MKECSLIQIILAVVLLLSSYGKEYAYKNKYCRTVYLQSINAKSLFLPF